MEPALHGGDAQAWHRRQDWRGCSGEQAAPRAVARCPCSSHFTPCQFTIPLTGTCEYNQLSLNALLSPEGCAYARLCAVRVQPPAALFINCSAYCALAAQDNGHRPVLMHVPKRPAVLLNVGAYAPATSGLTAAVMQLVPKSCGGLGFHNSSVNALAQSFCGTAGVPVHTYAACVGMLDVLCVHTDVPYSVTTGAQLAPMLPTLKLLASEERTSGIVQAYAKYIEVGLNIIESERNAAGLDPGGFESVCWGEEAVRGIDFILRSGLKDVPKFTRLLLDVRPRQIAHPQVLFAPFGLASVDTAKKSDALLTPAAFLMGGGECTAYFSKLKGDTPELKSLFSKIAMQACRDNGALGGAVRFTHSPAWRFAGRAAPHAQRPNLTKP